MFKRIITLALAIVCLASLTVVGASALMEPANSSEACYYVALGTPNKIEDVQGYITYDAEALEVVAVETPNIYGAIINYNEPGYIYFNATEVNNGMDFTEIADLIDVKFNILAEDVEAPAIVIEEMTERNGDSYFTNSEQVNDELFVGEVFLIGEDETEPTTTVAPTAATTVAPTEKATDAPATEAPVTDVTGFTSDAGEGTDVPPTGSNVAIFAAIAVVAMAGAAVVVLRKKVNG